MPENIRKNNIAIVLNQPRYPENIGAAARAMRNMGFEKLIVVKPGNFDIEKALRMATHEAADIVKNIRFFATLSQALAGFGYVVGTTARLGGQRVVTSPLAIAGEIAAISEKNRVALLFGREDRGLSNEDLRFCHRLINIPTDGFSSLNLAQAVLIVCYELFKSTMPSPKPFVPKLASRRELDGMYGQLKDILVKISYINPENPDYWMNHIRNFFTRMGIRARETSIIRGLIRQVTWYSEKRYKDGFDEGYSKALKNLNAGEKDAFDKIR